jgi:hypothetical protein
MGLISALLAQADLYGVEAVKLNINGKTEFTTPFGGAVSLFLRVLIIWYLVLNARKLFGKEDAALSQVS